MPSLGGLGAFDIGVGIVPVDLGTGANTGKRIFMGGVDSVTFVLVKDAGAAGEDPVLTLKRHTADTGGTTQDHDFIDEYWVKSETTLDNDETWTRVTQTADAAITDPGGAGTSAESEQIVVFNVKNSTMPSGYKYLSLDVADVGATGGQLGAVLYILNGVNKTGNAADFQAPLRVL